MNLSDILNELPESARLALTQQAIRDGRPIAELVIEAVLGAANRILAAKSKTQPQEAA